MGNDDKQYAITGQNWSKCLKRGEKKNRPRKRKLYFHVYAGNIRERERKKAIEKRDGGGKSSEGAKLIRGRELRERERERKSRGNERMRRRRVFRQLGKPSRDRSREDFFLENMLSFPHLTSFSILFSLTYACSLPLFLIPSSLSEFCPFLSFARSRDQISCEQIKMRNIGEFRTCAIKCSRNHRINLDKREKSKEPKY